VGAGTHLIQQTRELTFRSVTGYAAAHPSSSARSPDLASVGRRYQSAVPIGRYVTPDEIANTVLFLCSDLASAITGAQYVVDGARTATGGAVTQAMQT
jgi:NAD(P)-dependent dehydrogenase (short-subunit alcohol dehydrogenase family)